MDGGGRKSVEPTIHEQYVDRLRHAFATHLLEAGRDVHTVQRLLGHRYVSSTVRYFHLSQGHVLATPSPRALPEPRTA